MNTLNELFDSAVDCMHRQDWLAAAHLCDPASLTTFKRDILRRLNPTRADQSFTAEDLIRMNPDMPKEAAEYQVAMQTMHSDPAVILQDELPGVASPAALRSMAPAEVFARHLASYALDHQISMAQRYTNLPPHVIDRVRTEPWPVPGYVRLATFSDGDRLGYIVFRRDFSYRSDDADESQGAPGWAEYSAEEQQLAMDLSRGFPEFAPCYKQGDGTWRLIARHGFLGQGSFAFAFDEGTDQGTASE